MGCLMCGVFFRQMDQGQTQAPPLLSESDLIGLMDQKGIGTDATIAEHIQKIQQRKVGGGTVGWTRHAPGVVLCADKQRCCRPRRRSCTQAELEA